MINIRILDAITILEVHGPLAAGQEDAALRKAIRVAFENGATTVILNMADVPSIDSSGVAALASGHMTAANRSGRLKLCCLGRKLHDVFVVMRLHTVFESYDSEADALASVTVKQGESDWPTMTRASSTPRR
jgi:anti-sigma B factor antagonist